MIFDHDLNVCVLQEHYDAVPLVEGGTGSAGAYAGEGGAAAEGGGEGLAGISSMEVPEDLVRVLGLAANRAGLRRDAGGGLRAVELLRRLGHGFVEYPQHLCAVSLSGSDEEELLCYSERRGTDRNEV